MIAMMCVPTVAVPRASMLGGDQRCKGEVWSGDIWGKDERRGDDRQSEQATVWRGVP